MGLQWEKRQALYYLEPEVQGDYVVGVQLNTERPAKVGKNLKGAPVRIQYLGKNLRLFISRNHRSYFKADNTFDPEDIVVACELKDNLLKLHFPREKRLPTLESAFGHADKNPTE